MKKIAHLSMIAALLGMFFVSTTPAHALGTTITVNTTDGGSMAGDGLCSLQEAVAAANNDTAQDSGACPAGTAGIDTIAFDLPGTGVQTITLSALLSVSSPMILDGTTQPLYSGTPLVRIDGNDGNMWGVFLDGGSGGSTVRGLMITRFGYGDLVLVGSHGSKVVGNYIGTDGTTSLGGNYGILMQGSNNVIIGGATAADRNVIAGNSTDVSIDSGGTGVSIQGNTIGLFADGATSPLGKSFGITISTGFSPGSGGSNNTIGGLAPGEGNVIAGHTTAEIEISSDDQSFSDGNTIEGNIIGLQANGSSLAGVQSGDGIKIINSDTTLIEKNTIAGKLGAGVVLYYDSSLQPGGGTPVAPDHTTLLGNMIGTSQDGSAAQGNAVGIDVGDSTNTAIGGPTFADANLISGNTLAGIRLQYNSATGTTIQRNLIGVLKSGGGNFSTAGNGSHNVGDGNIVIATATDALVTNNWIANGDDNGLFFNNSGTLTTGSTANCIEGNASFGANQASNGGLIPVVDLTGNWWGNASGPTHSSNPGGSGDVVTDDVSYSGFLTSRPAACAPVVVLNTATLSFGSQAQGTTSAVQTVTLTNTGVKLLVFSGITTGAPYGLDATGTCPSGAGSLVSGSSCTIKVKFTPMASGAAPGSVSISTNAGSSPDHITLSGTGLTATQLLKNMSFEADANHDKRPDSWVFANFNVATDKRDCTVKKAGMCSLKFVGNKMMKTATETILRKGLAGDQLSFNLWSSATKVPSNATYRLTISLYNGAVLQTSQSMVFLPGTHGFAIVSGSLIAPGPYTKVVFKISYKAVSGSVWFDSASLTWVH